MSKNTSIFDFENYRDYLVQRLPTTGPSRGLRSKLAEALRCQTAFISRVLHGLADFSLEHAVLISRFLHHDEAEAEFFLLLVQHGRAGSKDLREQLAKLLARSREKQEQIRERIQVKQELSTEDQMTYYSAWYYAAIHILLLIPETRTKPAIAAHLGVPISLVSKVLEFLCSVGLAVKEGETYRAGASRIHLGKDSPMIFRHHGNWRMRAMQAIDRGSPEDLFYSGPISISEADAKRIKSLLLKTIGETETVIGPSKDEAMFCVSMDFFRV